MDFIQTDGKNYEVNQPLSHMIWLQPSEHKKQEYIVLRLYSPKSEKILLDFNPLKLSDEPDWNPSWEEWHCYQAPLRIFRQDYELLTHYFNQIYPIKDAFNGTPESVFDVVNDNWIGKNDWLKIISEIEKDLDIFSDDKKTFFTGFLEWLKEALNYTSIIVVEGNL